MAQRIIAFTPRNVRPGQFAPIVPSATPTVVIVTAVWGRLGVTRVWWKAARRMAHQLRQAGIQARIVVGGSEEEHRSLCVENGGEWVEVQNSPLGAKWNTICETAFHTGPGDYMFVIGSDDVVSPSLVQQYITAVKAGTPYAGIQSCLFYQASTGKLFNFSQVGITVGAGRLLHRNILEVAKLRPWMDNRERGLDASMDASCLRGRVQTKRLSTDAKNYIVDLKTETNIWSWARLRQALPNVPELSTDEYLSILPEWADIKSLTPQPSGA